MFRLALFKWLAVLAMALTASCGKSKQDVTSVVDSDNVSTKKASADPKSDIGPFGWTYLVSNDKLRGTSDQQAYVQTLGNNGNQVALLSFSRESSDSIDHCPSAYFIAGKYEIIETGSYLKYRIDNQPIRNTTYVRTDRGDTAYIHDNDCEFYNGVQSGSDVIMEVPIYGSGSRQYQFKVDGLSWARVEKKRK